MKQRYPGRTYLPNGSSYSRFVVSPHNWETDRAAIDIRWYLKYVFYDRLGKSKTRFLTGDVNQSDVLSIRQDRMRSLINKERAALHEGFNPVYMKPKENSVGVRKQKKRDKAYPIPTEYVPVDEQDTLKAAILKALWNPTGSQKHVDDLRRNSIRFLKAAASIKRDGLEISKVKRRDLLPIFIQMEKLDPQMSDKLYNRVRTHLIIVFNYLRKKEEVIQSNPVEAIEIKPTIEKLQDPLTFDEIQQALTYLKAKDYNFFRFMHIFYHSGARPAELCRLRYEDVFLDENIYRITVQKKKKWRQVAKPIHQNVLHLWKELMAEAKPGQYLFGLGFKPGDQKYQSAMYSFKFKSLVKDNLGITRNFYTLKHRKLSEIMVFLQSEEGLKLSQEVTQHAASHDSFSTTRVYLKDDEKRMNEILRKIQSRI